VPNKYDFGGYATKNDLKCSDGRTIRKDAFKDCDGLEVPLVWGHKHGSPGDVLGHAILENREDGVYTYGTFNNTESGKNAKELVKHGDVRALSIYANQLVQKGGDVLHGMIREVSLCLAGANPGAMIQELSIEHSDEDDTEIMEALIFNGNNIALEHADEKKEEKEEPEDKKEEKPMAEETKKTDNEKTVKDVWDSFTEEQKNVVYYMIGQALESKDDNSDEEETKMAHNVFEGDTYMNSLSHAEINEAFAAVVEDAKARKGSLKEYMEHALNDETNILAHATDANGMTVPDVNNTTYKTTVGYGINGVEYLYPEARALNNTPEFIGRRMDWVNVVLNGVHKSPFARVKSIFANITEDEARAKGYIKGTQKKNEFFSLMKRETLPQTIYKKQKFDRDDIVDITDMNVVAWIKGEMDMMLDEEKARAILIGDGRDVSDADKIREANIRPIVSDADLFTIKVVVPRGKDDEETGKNAIKAALKARKNYRGSGNTIMFTTDDWLTNMLLVEDTIGRRLYATEAELAAAARVRSMVTVPVMENYTNASNQELIGIIVDLADYNVGADRGGAKELFDDFDIDFNQYVYLLETRCSGALTKPYSAIALFAASTTPSSST
jgi:HK97 family phage prohead protease